MAVCAPSSSSSTRPPPLNAASANEGVRSSRVRASALALALAAGALRCTASGIECASARRWPAQAIPRRTSGANGASIAPSPSPAVVCTPKTTGILSRVAATARCSAAFAASAPGSSSTMSKATTRAAAEAAWLMTAACSARQVGSNLRCSAFSLSGSMPTRTTSPLHGASRGAVRPASIIVVLATRVSMSSRSSSPTQLARKSVKPAAALPISVQKRRRRSRSRSPKLFLQALAFVVEALAVALGLPRPVVSTAPRRSRRGSPRAGC